MINWYKIFNYDDFLALNIVMKTYQVNCVDVGLITFDVVRSNIVSVSYDGYLLPVDSFGGNPFEGEKYAIYKNNVGDVYLGFKEA